MALLNNPNPPPGYIGGGAITPHDSNENQWRAIHVGGLGSLAVRARNGENVTFSSVTPGTLLPIAVDRVYSTGTTATNLVGLR